MATSQRTNEQLQLFVPWRLHTLVHRVFNDFSNNGLMYYEGFRTVLISAISGYKLSSYHLDNLFNQVKNSRDSLDFELFLLAIEKLSMHIDNTKKDQILNEILCNVGNFYKSLPATEKLDISGSSHTRIYKNTNLNIPTTLKQQESLDLLTQYQPINIGVKYDLNKSNTTVETPKVLSKKVSFADIVKQDIKTTADATTSPRIIVEPANNDKKIMEKLETLDNVFKSTELLRVDFDKMSQNYMALKSSEEAWEQTTKNLENEKSSLREMIDSLLHDKKSLSEMAEKLEVEKNDLKILLDRKEKEIELYKNRSMDLITLEKMLALDSHEDTTLFYIFTYYRKLDLTSGIWVIDENSIVDFVFDYGMVEQHPVGENTMLRAKLAFEKASDTYKNLDFIRFKLFLAEYGKMAYMENDINRALKIAVENVIGNNYSQTEVNTHNCNYQMNFQPDESQGNSMPVQGTLWF